MTLENSCQATESGNAARALGGAFGGALLAIGGVGATLASAVCCALPIVFATLGIAGGTWMLDIAMVEVMGVVLVLVYVVRNQDVRAISLRRASKQERKYYANLQQN